VLVINAGVLERAPIDQITDDQWDRVVGVNLRGAFLCARAAWPALARTRGRLIAIGSISGTIGTAQAAAYNASKWGLTGLVKSLAEEGRERDRLERERCQHDRLLCMHCAHLRIANLTSRFGCSVINTDALCVAQTMISHFMHEQV